MVDSSESCRIKDVSESLIRFRDLVTFGSLVNSGTVEPGVFGDVVVEIWLSSALLGALFSSDRIFEAGKKEGNGNRVDGDEYG